ncbi:diaminopimelate decarboxylase family protein [Mycolicibacterium baixiangningiae]|uniref:diaminopimelate decarboxylase family protein n=1 Tax=Mycolicibacterium baixiangningiae TaxID=2761578 RepID=UPI0018686291|nr:diaminopimelate decarboxylase [Mycolicibacterium baixiangningiae]
MTLLDYVPTLQHAATPRIDPAIWPRTTTVDRHGRLCVGGVALTDVADQYGTPAYVLDEADFRSRLRDYRAALPDAALVYAGKSLLTTTVARWVAEAGAGVNVSSAGELATALAGGVQPARIILQGNGKPPKEVREALDAGVGRVVIDSLVEIAYLASAAPQPQPVLVHLTPGVDDDQAAAAAVQRIVAQPRLRLVGVHCHIGSQVTDPAHYDAAVRRMIAFMADVRARHGVLLGELDLGGGHGVGYVSGDPTLDLTEFAARIDDALDAACAAERFPRPRVMVEPGRAVSARAGVTLYRVLAVKSEQHGRTVVIVDGGMSDNPRVALYGAKYSVALANRNTPGPTQTVTVAGRHSESGDELIRNATLPADIRPGDLLAVPVTGAYHHSMASAYTMIGRPPVISVCLGRASELVCRETIDDLLARDRGWSAGNDEYRVGFDADGDGVARRERRGRRTGQLSE